MNEDPIKLSEAHHRMSQEYRRLSEEYSKIKKAEAFEKLELMKDCKTLKEAEWKYYATENGARGLELKFLLEGLNKEMQSTRSLVYAYQNHNF